MAFHPICIAADGVNFTVVGNVTEWLGQLPGREGVGGEAGMNESNRRNR